VVTKTLTPWHLASFRDFCEKTTGSHVALLVHNLSAESGKGLFRLEAQKTWQVFQSALKKLLKVFGWGVQIF